MMIAHAPAAYIANELIQKKKISKLKANEQLIVALLSLFFGILPDFDFFLTLILDIPTYRHHEILTHYPILYISIWAVLRLLAKPISKIINRKHENIISLNLLQIIFDTFLIATITHLLLDTRIAMFYPISQIQFGIFDVLNIQNLFTSYITAPLFMVECIIVSIFLYMVYKKILKQTKVATILLKSLICISIILFISSTVLTQFTYNSYQMKDSEGKINYDIDYDHLIDYKDMDIGNDWSNNLQKANPEDVSNSALNIVNSHKWSGNTKWKYLVGGLDPYRLISQTYFDIHLPLEPVVNDYIIKSSNPKEYLNSKIDYNKYLYEYLDKEERLIQLSHNPTLTLPYGRFLFLKDSSNEIVNVGITLEGNNIAIVLPEDKILQMHGFNIVLETYQEESTQIFIQK